MVKRVWRHAALAWAAGVLRGMAQVRLAGSTFLIRRASGGDTVPALRAPQTLKNFRTLGDFGSLVRQAGSDNSTCRGVSEIEENPVGSNSASPGCPAVDG